MRLSSVQSCVEPLALPESGMPRSGQCADTPPSVAFSETIRAPSNVIQLYTVNMGEELLFRYLTFTRTAPFSLAPCHSLP